MEHKISELISKYDSSQDELQIESQRKLIEDAYQRDAAHERRQTADFPKDAEENRSQYSSRMQYLAKQGIPSSKGAPHRSEYQPVAPGHYSACSTGRRASSPNIQAHGVQ